MREYVFVSSVNHGFGGQARVQGKGKGWVEVEVEHKKRAVNRHTGTTTNWAHVCLSDHTPSVCLSYRPACGQ